MTTTDIAFVLCGGNALPNVAPATVLWENYLKSAVAIGPQIQAAKLHRVLYHNPGGHYYLGWTPNPNNVHDPSQINKARAAKVITKEMWVNQWLLAESCGCRFADRKALRLGHEVLEYYGVEEVIYYLGSPADIKTNNIDDCFDCVRMFLACGKSASLAFDALGWDVSPWVDGDMISRFIDEVRDRGHKVYIEPRFNSDQLNAKLGRSINGTLARQDFDNFYKPDLANQPGELIVDPLLMVSEAATYTPPADATVCWRTPYNWTQPPA